MKKLPALLLTLACLGAQDVPFRENYPKDGVAWAAEWSDALAESRWRNVPIHLAFHDDSAASRSVTASVYADPKFIEASRMWVNVPIHARGGHSIGVDRGGGRVTVCERFWGSTCDVHIRNDALAAGFKETGKRPLAVFTRVDLQELGRSDARAGADILKAQEKVVASWEGARVPLAVWKEASDFRSDGDQFLKLKFWRKSIDSYQKIRKPKFKSLGELADDCLAKVNAQGEGLLEAATKDLADPKKAEEAKKALRQVTKDFTPLPVAEKAQRALDDQKAKGK